MSETAWSNLSVRHGLLQQLLGSAHEWKGVTFYPASVGLLGSAFTRTHQLADFVARHGVPAAVQTLLLGKYDGPWVRGRLERLFFSALERDNELRGEKSGLKAELLAVLSTDSGALIGVPFLCGDHYLKTGLVFSEQEDPSPAELYDRIAEAFWGLLLSEPHDVPTYTDVMYHIGAGIWMEFGIACGQPFIEEHEREPRLDNHRGRRA